MAAGPNSTSKPLFIKERSKFVLSYFVFLVYFFTGEHKTVGLNDL